MIEVAQVALFRAKTETPYRNQRTEKKTEKHLQSATCATQAAAFDHGKTGADLDALHRVQPAERAHDAHLHALIERIAGQGWRVDGDDPDRCPERIAVHARAP